MQKKITILGNSHAYALSAGTSDSPNYYRYKFLMDFRDKYWIARDGDPPELKNDVAHWLDAELDVDLLLLAIVSSNYLEYCLTNREPKFDIILPNAPNLGEIPGAQIVPLAEMRQTLLQNFAIAQNLRGMLALRHHMPAIPMRQAPLLPPFEDNDRLQHLAESVPAVAAEIAKHGVTDPILRLKIYLLLTELVTETCAKSNIKYTPPPKEALTGPGFLAPEYVRDLFHANERYGQLVIADIDARLESER